MAPKTKTEKKPKNIKKGLTIKKTFDDLSNFFQKQTKGETFKVVDNKTKKETIYKIPEKNKIFNEIESTFWDYIYDQDEADLSIFPFDKQEQSNEPVYQSFKEGEYNCVLKPILNFCNNKLNDSSITDKTKSKYRTMIKKIEKYNKTYKNGIDLEAIPIICKDLAVNMTIYPLYHLCDKNTKPIINYKAPNKPNNSYVYYNISKDHVELIGGDTEEVDEITDIKDAILYKKYNNKIVKKITLNKIYKLKNDTIEIFKKFEEETGLCDLKMCSVENKEVSDFIFSGCRDSYTYDFKYIKRSTDEWDKDTISINNSSNKSTIDENDPEIKGIDQVKAYTKCNMCDYFQGFPAKITDFRKTTKIEGIGFYEIRNLKCPDILKELGYNDGVYPSVELEWMKTEYGCTFDIFQGAWGTDFYFTYPDYMLKKNNTGLSYYCIHAGCSIINSDKNYYITNKNNNQLINNYTETYLDDEECIFQIPKKSNEHLAHVYGFIFSYVRMRSIDMIQNIIKQNGYESLVRVCKDGIYYTGKEIKKCGWSNNKEIKLGNYGSYFFSPVKSEIEALGEYKKFYQHSIHAGAGGTGKTHNNILDKGNVGLIYIVNSHKLRTAKLNDYKNLHTSVNAYLLNDKNSYYGRKHIMKHNVLLIDECSMLTNDDKEHIIDKYPFHKILFVGDVQCQLPPIQDDKDIMSFDDIHTTWYDTYYRFSGQLLDLQVDLRNYMLGDDIENFVKTINKFQSITKEELKEKYKKEDIILCHKRTTCDKYTDMFKDIEKFYMEGCDKYNKGEILITRPNSNKFEIKHGYTVHSVQGETFYDNIYIDSEDMRFLGFDLKSKLIYTAITRAKKYEQIFFII